jgi:hypothetical protein
MALVSEFRHRYWAHVRPARRKHVLARARDTLQDRFFIILTGSGRRQSIGRFPIISLASARTRAKELLAEQTLGKTRPRAVAFDDAVTDFLAACEKKNRARTVRDYTRLLHRHFAFGWKNLVEITRHDISQKLEKLNGLPSEQNHAIVAAKIFFKWAVRNGYVDQSPWLPTIEKLLNHVSGSFGGIVAVYQRHNWLPEMRSAIEVWEKWLASALERKWAAMCSHV